jgi:hypothetical protein
MRFLYACWQMAVTADVLGSVLVAIALFRLRQRFGWYLAIMMGGVAIEAILARFTMQVWSPVCTVSPWLFALRMTGRLVKAGTLFVLLLYLYGYINGRGGERITTS